MGNWLLFGWVNLFSGDCLLIQGDYLNARIRYQGSLDLARYSKNKYAISSCLYRQGLVALSLEDYDDLEKCFQEGLEIGRYLTEYNIEVFSLQSLGIVALHRGQIEQASKLFMESLAPAHKAADSYQLIWFLACMAAVARHVDKPRQAARLLGAHEAQMEGFFKPIDAWHRGEYNRILESVRSSLDEATFKAAWAEGRSLSLEEAIAVAREIPVE